MSFAEYDERPAKKRRFFVEDSPEPQSAADPSGVNLSGSPSSEQHSGFSNHETSASSLEDGFDVQLLESIVGEKLSLETTKKLQEQSAGNIERAINLYLDGSWASDTSGGATTPNGMHASNKGEEPQPADAIVEDAGPTPKEMNGSKQTSPPRASIPQKRYIGAFGVVCWATRSGTNLIKSGETVNIERAKTTSVAKFGKSSKSKGLGRQDIIVRFTNPRGEEVGRLETEYANWVSTLLDQKVCYMEGFCVFAPERVRSSDTIYLQLKCFFLKQAFDAGKFITPADDNRQTGLFESKETQGERDLHLRQVALVRLFDEINLSPSKSNSTTEKHKRQGLLKAAESAERYEESNEQKLSTTATNGGSSPPSEEAEEEEGEELEQDQLDSLYRKAQSFDFDTPEHEPSTTFVMDLRKYQKQALHWMVSKETAQKSDHKDASMHPLWEEYDWPTKDADDKPLGDVPGTSKFYVNPYSGEVSLRFPVQEQNCLGGILADEMGLGKTIEMLSLMHTHQSEVAQQLSLKNTNRSLNNLPRLPRDSAAVENAPCTTLVVAPMSLLAQWESEAHKASKESTLKVLMYYGAMRNDKGTLNLQNLCCEANAASAPNLIITSYGTVLSEYNQVAAAGGNRGSHGGLFSLNYFRVILDEAHHIKNRQSKTAKACYEINATHRWVLTGTPIVNRLEDLFSLVHFLRVEPWSNFSFWKTFITVPFESKDYVKALDVVQTVLEPLVLRRTKDMKTPDGQALVPLPPRIIDIERLELSKEERDVYNFIYSRAKRTFAANVEAGTLMKSYTTIFAQILRLRQSCCHPILTRNKEIVAEEEDSAAAADAAAGLADDMDLQALIERFTSEEDEQSANKFGAHALKQIQDEAKNECPICAEEPMIDQAVTGCWHSACKKCLMDVINHARDKGELPRCFNCREPINVRDVFEVVRHEDFDEPSSSLPEGDTKGSRSESPSSPSISLRRLNQPSSAKITALLAHLTSIRRTSPETKSVVFSQFTSFLNLVEPALRRARIPFLRFDGTMAQKQRAAVLASFSSDERKSKGTVLLLSLRAGGVGLNLTAAQRVFMLDPWWSWAVEAQAIDRVHRMGQDREVKVVRFVCEESIEEKMLRIQERKKFIASSLGMMSEEEKRVQRIEDIRELLS